MLNKLKKILAAPTFENEDKNRAAQYLNAILNTSILAFVPLLISGEFHISVSITLLVMLGIFIGIRFLMFSGKVALSSFLYILMAWLSITYLAWIGNGFRDAGLIAYVIFIFLASLLGNTRHSVALTAVSILSVWLLLYAENTGIIIPQEDSPISIALVISAIFILIETVIYFTVTNLSQSLNSVKRNELKLIARNEKLLELQNKLEKHVIQTENASIKAKTHTTRLETIAKVSQAIALNQNLDTLLPNITTRISADFAFYHVGIFLLSDDKKFAQLVASNSFGGKQMLARKHQLEIGQVGIVGRTAHDAQARIALDVGQDAAYFDNPDLPETRSEMALALKVRNEIIGVLDVQSKRKSAFIQEDAQIFETLANQIAIAIENARQTEITQAALEEAQEVTRQYIHQAWTELSASQQQQSYRYAEKKITTLNIEENLPESEEEIYAIPVKVMDETIGFLEIHKNNTSETLTKDELDLVQAIANRVALALDNARLLEETKRRAGREHLVSQITAKIRSKDDPQAMIETALEELKSVLGASKVELSA